MNQIEIGVEPESTFQPFPELPPMTLRLFGIQYSHHNPPNTSDRGEWDAYNRYTLFREGIADMLGFQERTRLRLAGYVACRILRPKLSPLLFARSDEGLTYRGHVPDTKIARNEVRVFRLSQTKMYVMDVFYGVTQGDTPEGWEELQELVSLHRQVGSDL
jgi:hypothetical protein